MRAKIVLHFLPSLYARIFLCVSMTAEVSEIGAIKIKEGDMKGTGEKGQSAQEKALQLLTGSGDSESLQKLQDIQKRQKEKCYHNTQLLLRHYRNIAWMLECFPEQIAQEVDCPFEQLDTLIDRLDVEMAYGNKRLENRMNTIRQSRLLLDRINEALTVLRKKPSDGELLYELIYLTYIAPEVLTHMQILYRLNISTRQYYRLRERAIEVLSLRLWAAPSTEIGFWFELLAGME